MTDLYPDLVLEKTIKNAKGYELCSRNVEDERQGQ